MLLLDREISAIEALLPRTNRARNFVVVGLAERFCDRRHPLSRLEAQVYDEVVWWLSADRDTHVRAEIAARLAGVEQGPARTVHSLAYDPSPDVAALILQHSTLITDRDLIEIARSRSDAHLCAIAARQCVSEPVVDALLERGSWSVLRAVAANGEAQLSQHTLRRLARAAEGDGQITVGLLRRKDVPAAVLISLALRFREFGPDEQLWPRGEASGISLGGDLQGGS